MWTEYFWEFHHIVQNSFESEYFADIVVVPSFGNNDDIVKNFNSLNQSFSFSSTMTCLKFFRNESHLHIPMRSYLTETYTRKKKSNLHLAKMYSLSLRQKQSFLKCWLVSSNFFFQKMYTRYIFTVSQTQVITRNRLFHASTQFMFHWWKCSSMGMVGLSGGERVSE